MTDSSFASPSTAGEVRPSLISAQASVAVASPTARDGVGEIPQGLTDAEREEAIKRAGAAVERHMAEWQRSGCFAARGDADRAMRLMYQLIAGRSPEQVARMEAERGLA